LTSSKSKSKRLCLCCSMLCNKTWRD